MDQGAQGKWREGAENVTGGERDMVIEFYGHTFELSDSLIEKHGKMAGYCYCKTPEELKKCLVVEMRSALYNELVEQKYINTDRLYTNYVFEHFNDAQIVKMIEKRFQREIDENT